MSLANNILDEFSLNTTLSNSLLVAASELLISQSVETESVLQEFNFETDGYDTIEVVQWWKVAQSKIVFPVANSVGGQDYLPDDTMKYFAGYLINKSDTTIPVYDAIPRIGILYDLLSSALYSLLRSDFRYCNVCLQMCSQFIKYFSVEERIEEVANGIIQDTDCYEL